MKQLLTTTILTAVFTLLAAMSLTAKQRVSIHAPSVVYDQSTGRYYIVGSHKAGAFSADLQNWSAANPTWQPDDNAAAFATPAVKTVRKGGADAAPPPRRDGCRGGGFVRPPPGLQSSCRSGRPPCKARR